MLLRETDKYLLLQIFEDVAYPMEIWAYGSRVDGTAHAASDRDLVIRGSGLQPLPRELIVDIRTTIRESNVPILVNVFDWASLPLNFQHQIDALHEVFYCNVTNILEAPPVEYRRKDSHIG